MFADKGAQGRSSPQWSRWSDVPAGWEVIQERDPRLIEACRKCGKRFYDAHSRGGHEGKCRAAGVALPPGRGRCRKCGEEMQIRTVKSHEQKCTGDRAQKTSDFFVFMSSIVEDYRIDGPPKLQRRSSIWNRKCGQRMRLGGNVTNVGCGRLCVICRDT